MNTIAYWVVYDKVMRRSLIFTSLITYPWSSVVLIFAGSLFGKKLVNE